MALSQLFEQCFIILKLNNGCVQWQDDMAEKINSSSIPATF